MAWTMHTRTGHQYALRRALRELGVALEHANEAGDENAANRIVDAQMSIEQLRQWNINHQRVPPGLGQQMKLA